MCISNECNALRLEWHRKRRIIFPTVVAGATLEIIKDFAAGRAAHRGKSLTCETGQTIHCDVMVLSYDWRYLDAENLQDGPFKRKMLREGVSAVLTATKLYVHAFGAAKHDAVFDTEALLDVLSLILYGGLPEKSGCVAFWGGKAAKGSVNYAATDTDAFDTYFAGDLGYAEHTDPLSIMAKQKVTRVEQRCDGCVGQNVCATAKGVQEDFTTKFYKRMEGIDGYTNEELARQIQGTQHIITQWESYHGKNEVDAAGAETQRVEKMHAKAHTEASPGAFGTAIMMAKHCTENKFDKGQDQKPGVVGGRIIIYYSSQHLQDKRNEHRKYGACYKGVKNTRSTEAANTNPTGDGRGLHVRTRPCACVWCLAGEFSKCVLQRFVGSVRRESVPKTSDAASTRVANQAQDVESYKDKIKSGVRVVVRIATEDASAYPDEDFFIGLATSKVRTLKKAELHAGNDYGIGFYVFNMQWMERVPTKPGAPLRFRKWRKPVTTTITAVVADAHDIINSSDCFFHDAGGVWKLTTDAERRIQRFSSVSL